MDELTERCAGLDVHRDTVVVATVRSPAFLGSTQLRGSQISVAGTPMAVVVLAVESNGIAAGAGAGFVHDQKTPPARKAAIRRTLRLRHTD